TEFARSVLSILAQHWLRSEAVYRSSIVLVARSERCGTEQDRNSKRALPKYLATDTALSAHTSGERE
ncbi:hypothetical protein, partial [Chloroflexus sp.]|uniref:hypothetical protein n=1 Tax=Chloroflexus sp. TaxID=1904827 RepID=UPI002ACEFA7D